LEQVYLKLLPFMSNVPNYNLFADKEVCPNCGSNHTHKNGIRVLPSKRVQRFQCNDCGASFSKANDKAIPKV
jgi:transposase-like protein